MVLEISSGKGPFVVESNLCQIWRRVFGEGWGRFGQWSKFGVHMGLACERAYAQDGILIPISYGLKFEMGPR